MHEQEFLAVTMYAPLSRLYGQSLHEFQINPCGGSRLFANPAKEHFFMIALNRQERAILKERHDFVGEAILTDAIPKAEELIDGPHDFQCTGQRNRIAMYVRHHPYLQRTSPDLAPLFDISRGLCSQLLRNGTAAVVRRRRSLALFPMYTRDA